MKTCMIFLSFLIPASAFAKPDECTGSLNGLIAALKPYDKGAVIEPYISESAKESARKILSKIEQGRDQISDCSLYHKYAGELAGTVDKNKVVAKPDN